MRTLVALCAAVLAGVRTACADGVSSHAARATVFFVGCHPDDFYEELPGEGLNLVAQRRVWSKVPKDRRYTLI